MVLALPIRLLAVQAVVATRNGKTYEGYVRFSTNLVVIANAEKGFVAQVGVSNLKSVAFKKESDWMLPPYRPARGQPGGGFYSLPDSWQSEDIGSVPMAGSASCVADLFRVMSAGTNIADESDSFHFVYRPVNGDSEIMARVLQTQATAPGAKAGLMMRGDMTADAPNVLLAVTAGRRGILQWRDSKAAATSQPPAGETGVGNWLRLKRNGDMFASYQSRNGRQWSLVDRITLSLPEEIFVGLAVASGHEARLSRATFDHVREGPWLANPSFAPRVELRNGSVVLWPIQSADGTRIRFGGPPARPSLPLQQVAKILFNWVPYRQAAKVNSGQPGILLASGEFLEGEFYGFDNGQVLLSSVLFGLRQYDAGQEVIAVVLHKSRGTTPQYEVTTADGSTWYGDDLGIGWNEVVLGDAALGHSRFPIYELAEVWRW